MSMLDKIRDVLERRGTTYYGNATPDEREPWNYYVFRRVVLKKSGTGGTDFRRHYMVAIIKENYIPEGEEFEVIKEIREATKMRLADVDISYGYTHKGATDLVVEVAVITFSETIKGCEI